MLANLGRGIVVKKKIIVLLSVVLIICLGLWLYMQMPSSFLKDIAPEDISSITVRDGSNGQTFTIIEDSDIAHIAAAIQGTEFKKEKLSLLYVGTLYTLRFYDENGVERESFILNSDDIIRRDPFFYRASEPLGGLTEYIQGLNNEE